MSARRSPPSSPAPSAVDLDDLLEGRHIIVCTGSGGVGKTTLSAALALRAAERGRRAIVCTIDPARRLAQSLGLTNLDNTPRRVDLASEDDPEGAGGRAAARDDPAGGQRAARDDPAGGQRAARDDPAGGQLWAMMLDMKRTFDEMIADLATPERAETILRNPFYRHVSSTLSGSQEYMAMEKLWELHEEGRWELIVVDTPPTRSALDFLDAPRRVTDFLEGRFLKVLLWPTMQAGKGYLKALNVGAQMVLRTVTRITGTELFQDVASFFAAFDGMYGSFKLRAERVRELLGAKRTAFVVVATPTVPSLREAGYFLDRLATERMPLGGLVVNRSHEIPSGRGLEDPRALAPSHPPPGGDEGKILSWALEAYASWKDLAVAEERLLGESFGRRPSVPMWKAPDFAEAVNSLPSLRRIGEALADGPRLTGALPLTHGLRLDATMGPETGQNTPGRT